MGTSYGRTGTLVLLCIGTIVSSVAAAGPVGAIQNLRTPSEVDALVEAARTGGPAQRVKALEAGLGVMRKDFKAAVAECLRHADPQVRLWAVGALGRFAGSKQDAARPILQAALSDADAKVAEWAAEALRRWDAYPASQPTSRPSPTALRG